MGEPDTRTHVETRSDADKRRIAQSEAEVAAVRGYRLQCITASLRAVKQRLLQSLHRALKLLWWLGSGHFTRATVTVLPYYRRYVPTAVKAFISNSVPMAVKGRLIGHADAQARRSWYARWIAQNDMLTEHDRALIRAHIRAFKKKPKLSLVIAVCNAPAKHLHQAMESIRGQLYSDWELRVIADPSWSRQVRPVLEEYAQKDSRIRQPYREVQCGTAACASTVLDMASGEWVVLMDQDVVLSEHALYAIVDAINRHTKVGIIYSDEDQIDAQGRRAMPYFKPDWDYDLFLGQNLIGHVAAYRADLARQACGFRDVFEGFQHWGFALRVLEAVPDVQVHHIPFILYHCYQTSKTSQTSMTHERDLMCRTVSEHLRRTGQAAEVIAEGHGSYFRIKRALPLERPLVSIIIPTKDHCELLRNCIDGLLDRTDYAPLEIVIVDNGSSEPDARAFLAQIRLQENIKVLEDSRPFNFSRLVNQGVAACSGGMCVLLNNDIDIINSDWLAEMVSHAVRPEVGAVGAKLYYVNNTLQHGGVILGLGGVAGHMHRFFPRKSPGYFNQLNLTRNLSCVTAACVALRREVYEALGGFNEQDLKIAYNDVEFCIRVRQAGYKIVWTPHAELYHYESLSRGSDSDPENLPRYRAEIAHMRDHWGPILDSDPFYNPNLSLTVDYDLAETSRVRKPWREFAVLPPPSAFSRDRPKSGKDSINYGTNAG